MKPLIGNGIPAGTLTKPTNQGGMIALLEALDKHPVAPGTSA